MAFDVFISYASKDKTVADAVCARLEAAGVRCWIAPRDITAGTSYGEAIIDAIRGARAMVLVFSSNANLSGHIPKEVERAVSRGLAIIPFRIEDVAPGKSLDYFIGSVHWLDALTPPMEKHLDDLAATVQKILPPKGSDEHVPMPHASESGVWQRSDVASGAGQTPQLVQTAAPSVPETNAAGAKSAAPQSKMIWMGIAAVAVIALIVIAVVMLRGSKSQGTENAASNGGPGGAPSSSAPPNMSSSSPSNPSTGAPNTSPSAPPATPAASIDPVVGCYIWFNNAPVVIRPDGTMTAGPFSGRWRVTNAARKQYTFTWPEAVDTVTVSPDGKSLTGGNQYGYPTSGVRLGAGSGLIGVWRWPNGVPVNVAADGTFTAATFRGRWAAANAAAGTYTLTWPNPVDSVTLSANGTRVSGADQYGVAISGTKTGNCAGN